jgi:hypothetical protein
MLFYGLNKRSSSNFGVIFFFANFLKVDFRSRMLAFRGACSEPLGWRQKCAPASARNSIAACFLVACLAEKYTQVVGTLIPQESRTLRSNQLVKEENGTKIPKGCQR